MGYGTKEGTVVIGFGGRAAIGETDRKQYFDKLKQTGLHVKG